MATHEESGRGMLSPTARRLLRSYGIIVLIALAFLFLALFVREKDTTVPVEGMGRAPVVVQVR